MYQNNYNLNFVPGGVPLTIHISQYDVGTRTFHFTPIAVPGTVTTFTGASATLEATKPDGYAVIQDCTYNSDGTIDYTVQDQLAAKAGKVWSKIVLRDGTDVIGTAAVVWIVDKAGVTDDAIVSDSDVSGIRGLIEAEVRNALATALPIGKASGAVASFTDGADNVPVEDLKISIEPKQSGSGDPSPDNVRPISGWTAANVVRSGKNLVQFAPVSNASDKGVEYSITSDGKLTMSGTATANSKPYATDTSTKYALMPYGPFPAGTYTIIANGLVGANINDRIIASAIYDDGESFFSNIRISGEGNIIPNGIGRPYTFTATKPFKMGLYILILSGSTVNCEVTFQMEVGTSVGEWEQYKGQTYPISFGSAGTVYGGTLDVTTGVLTVDKALITFTTSNSSITKSSLTSLDVFLVNGYGKTVDYVLDGNVKLDKFRFVNSTTTQGVNDAWIGASATQLRIGFSAYGTTTLAQFKEWLDENTLQMVVTLASPQTYQLTPTELRTLLGLNNIFADTGDSAVEYRAETGRYIENRIAAQQKLISGVETSYTATKNYAIGDYVIVADTLYKVTSAIASGATITPGTNCVATTVAEQLILLAQA